MSSVFFDLEKDGHHIGYNKHIYVLNFWKQISAYIDIQTCRKKFFKEHWLYVTVKVFFIFKNSWAQRL